MIKTDPPDDRQVALGFIVATEMTHLGSTNDAALVSLGPRQRSASYHR